VKPGNIFLAQTGQDELQVRVVDFGIAKLAADEDTFTSLTQDGRAPHSPAFASPEQLRGLSHLSPASDVFSLGAVGFQLLTGERPFSEADRNRMSLGMPVPVPSLRSRNPAIPSAVEAIIQRALAFDAEERFPDAAEMATALDHVLRQLPELPLDSYPAVSLPPLIESHEIASADEDRTEYMDAEDDRTLAAPGPGPAHPAEAEAEDADAETAEPELPALTPAAKPPLPPRRRRTSALVWTLGLLAILALATWAILQQGGGGRFAAEPPSGPDTMAIVPADSLAQDSVPDQAAVDAFVHNQEGRRYYEAGQFQSAAQQYGLAVELKPENATYRRNYAVSLLQLGRSAEATRQLERALQLDPGLVLAYANLAQAQLAQADSGAAIASLERFTELSPNGRPKQIAQQQLRELKAARAGLLGVPITPTPTDTARPDTVAPAPEPAG
jgi:tetratricopeptide (TPR) repeat protein